MRRRANLTDVITRLFKKHAMWLSESVHNNLVLGYHHESITGGRNAKRRATKMWWYDGFRAGLFGIQVPVFRHAESCVSSIFNGVDVGRASRALSMDGAKNHSTTWRTGSSACLMVGQEATI